MKEKEGPNVINDKATDKEKLVIESARAIMYKDDGAFIRQALTASKDVGAAIQKMLVMLLRMVESKLGELSREELAVVIPHLLGTIVHFGQLTGEPTMTGQNAKAIGEKVVYETINELAPPNEQAGPQPTGLMGGAA